MNEQCQKAITFPKLFYSSDLATIPWAKIPSWISYYILQGGRESERRPSQNRVGWEGGAAMERAWAWMLHWGLVFWWKIVAELSQLLQQWQQERPGTRADWGERNVAEEKGGREGREGGTNSPRGAEVTDGCFWERISQIEEEGTVNNKELHHFRHDTGEALRYSWFLLELVDANNNRWV